MRNLSIEILGDKTIYAKWEEKFYNESGELVGYGFPSRRALIPSSLVDRIFVEQEGGELKAYADIAWLDIPYPSGNNEQSLPE
ncbi:hypothetical protein GFS24_10200 [Chitinophaga sp. SYP-B3965]|uniref:hypothetical protein n=1 Tax=Chitinophaga sp. SYP-B3965 TaxID=2663120 RepID=UPI0012999A9B|nr:hypothetical protein [Chitinophaga sp. SYP-B3965]MRG45488.1 hypothetical protein [Chitinophaga sp. SYP-B3965]